MLDDLFPLVVLAVSSVSLIIVTPHATVANNSHSAPASQSDTWMFDNKKKLRRTNSN